MTQPALETLNLLLDRAVGERDRALTQFNNAEAAQQRQLAQSTQLTAYRAEYLARWSSAFSRAAAVEIVNCYRSFMDRLDEAVSHQQRQAAQAAANADRARALLLQCETRVASVRKLIERRQREHQNLNARREQRQTDESAQQASWRARQGASLLHHS